MLEAGETKVQTKESENGQLREQLKAFQAEIDRVKDELGQLQKAHERNEEVRR